MYPSFERFRELKKGFNRVTVYKETDGDMDTPVSILLRLLGTGNAILLESAKENKVYSRFSFLAFDIRERLVLKGDGLHGNGKQVKDISYLKDVLSKNTAPPSDLFGDFTGGYIGYFNFEFVERCGILRAPLRKRNDVAGVLYLVERFCVYDNYTNRLYIAISKGVDDSVPAEEEYDSIQRDLDDAEQWMKCLPAGDVPVSEAPVVVRKIPKDDFTGKVKRIKEMIGDGEAIQIVLSDFMEVDNIDPFAFYRTLRKINPSPYMYFIKDGDSSIVGSSPEVHIKIRNRVATLRPIAGTMPRDGFAETEDIIKALKNDEKEKAEHLMLVDLARNDLGRICKTGSVEVESFMEPEIYSHVIHLVSQVKGLLTDGTDVIDAVGQTFPAGTVSGAPKTRAIEIIDELEEEMRGPYAGCTGYIGFNGNVDMAITIRTAVFTGQKARLRAGAGIVYDSVPEREYEEVMNKLKALIRSGGIDDSIDR